MADIFISYNSDDRERVAALVEVLEAEGFTTWWDRRIGMGSVFDREIERELGAASCVVVVWSKGSVDSDWVREEASDALERNILVPVRIDDCRPPLGFRRIQTAALVDWPANRSNLSEFLDAVRMMIGVAAPANTDTSDINRVGTPRRVATPATADSAKSVLVLPFENLGRDPDDDYFTDGLTEELITDLIRTKALRVVPSGSAFRLKGASNDMGTLAAGLGVRYVVEGRVRRSADNVRVTVQLIDMQDDSPLWAERFTGRIEDALEFQESVSRAVADALQVELSATVVAPKRESVDAVLRGRHFYRQKSSDGLHKALECFSEVTRLDPGYAPAFSHLADTYVDLSRAWDVIASSDNAPRARAAAMRALELDPSLSEAHVARGLVATYYDWDLPTAEASFREAIRLNPNHPDAYVGHAHLLIWLDTRFAEALEQINRAIELDPLEPQLQVERSFVHYFSRDFEAAIAAGREAVALDPYYSVGHYVLANGLTTIGRVEEGLGHIKRAIELDGRSVHLVTWLGFGHAMAGNVGAAHQCLSELDEHERNGRSVWAWKLCVYSALGENGHVMECLEQALDERSASLVFLPTHPLVDCVREDARFKGLLERMGLPHLADYEPVERWHPDKFT